MTGILILSLGAALLMVATAGIYAGVEFRRGSRFAQFQAELALHALATTAPIAPAWKVRRAA